MKPQSSSNPNTVSKKMFVMMLPPLKSLMGFKDGCARYRPSGLLYLAGILGTLYPSDETAPLQAFIPEGQTIPVPIE